MSSTEGEALNQVSAYDYNLPEDLIARAPSAERSASKLMVCRDNRRDSMTFSKIVDFLRPGDLVVFNDTQVVPCRLPARRATGGQVEIFVLGPLEGGGWFTEGEVETRARALTKSNKSLRPGETLTIIQSGARAVLVGRLDDGTWEVCFKTDDAGLPALLEAAGQVPLPPYIVGRRKAEGEALSHTWDRKRYQTVYDRNPGAVAAPTAGLHFSETLLESLQRQGVELGFLTLHVGIGTFRPLQDGEITGQSLHEERYWISQTLAETIEATASAGGRIIAVRTTATRALEDQGRRHQSRRVEAGSYSTDIFIKPGFEWRLVDAMVTNFHLPKSSLLVLVAALMGHSKVMEAYESAIEQKMRFYSYGDAMLIFREADA